MLGFNDDREYSLAETLERQTPVLHRMMFTNAHPGIMALILEPGDADYWLNAGETVTITTMGEEQFEFHLVLYSKEQVRLYARGKSRDIEFWLNDVLLSVGHNRPSDVRGCPDLPSG